MSNFISNTSKALKTSLWILLLANISTAFAHNHGLQAQKSLYQRLGGLEPVAVVVSDFIDAIVPDPMLNKNRAISISRKSVAVPYLKYQVTAMVCQATGGPCKYTGRNMKDAHAHLRIKEKEWDRMIVLFKEVLKKHRLSDKITEELLAIVQSSKKDIVIPSM